MGIIIEKHTDNPAVIEITQEQKKEVRQGSIKMHRGHKLFELNLKTKEIKVVKFDHVDYVLTTSEMNQVSKKFTEQPDCIYIAALNEKNALKKLFKKLGK